jgi:hypothetical protein
MDRLMALQTFARVVTIQNHETGDDIGVVIVHRYQYLEQIVFMRTWLFGTRTVACAVRWIVRSLVTRNPDSLKGN